MNKTTWFVIIAILIVIAVGAWWVSTMDKEPAPSVTNGQVEGSMVQEFTDGSKDGAAEGVTIRYTTEGFVPSSVTVKKGTPVTFVNQTAEEMWIASDEHPTHTQYDDTNKDTHCVDGVATAGAFDQCAVGTSYTFTFGKAGTWGYHNHREDDHHGTVIVTE